MAAMFQLIRVALFAAITVVASTASRTAFGDSSETRPLSILLITPDAPGHSLPYLTLGETLRDRGHNVSVVTDKTFSSGHKFKELCTEAGLPFHSYGSSEALVVDDEMLRRMGTGPSVILKMLPMLLQTQNTMIEALAARHIDGTDVVVLDALFPAVTQWLNANTNITVVSFTQAMPLSITGLPSWHYPMVMLQGGPEPTFTHRLTSALVPILLEAIGKTVGYSYHHYLPMFTPAGIHNPDIAAVAFGFDYPRPLYPMMHYVGPVVSQRKEVLSDDLQVWLDQKCAL